MRPQVAKMLWFAPLGILAMFLFIFLGGEVVQLLWNWLTPHLFGWPPITFWQAIGIIGLCRILFGSWGGRCHGGHYPVRGPIIDRLADRIGERWQAMTPEERDRFRQRMQEKWGYGPNTASGSQGSGPAAH